ncbi:type II secretion system minor pseudopilin GspI [Yersinia hibernica]|uniref:Type II secretion system protein I n=1 Tax=Yersinia hibernica TaxID=2339259 RepID=A0ABX5R4W1_9GAMM|nr:type II secretion system minor pseudopilin GspI [Yersinia hibernica]QAX80401.1 type II secretion system protein GspI [Yersinia hibernica]
MNCRGMTLLEVLVALVVLASAGLAIIKSTGEQVRNLSHLEKKQFAAWVAENQLVRLRLQNVWPAEHWHEGKSTMADITWHWRWRGVATSDAQVRALEIEVSQNEHYSAPLSGLRSYQVKS